jgi:NADH-quinone oxidoreductase subunit J
MAQTFFFFYFSGVTILSSILTIGLKHPIHSTVALLSALLHVAGIFILLQAEFIAAIQIIIYAGAILVLYLFVLMLLNQKETETIVNRQYHLALFFGAVLLCEILLALFQSPFLNKGNISPPTGQVAQSYNNTESIGVALFTDYLLQFEVVGVLLLGGIVGALVLAKQTPTR